MKEEIDQNTNINQINWSFQPNSFIVSNKLCCSQLLCYANQIWVYLYQRNYLYAKEDLTIPSKMFIKIFNISLKQKIIATLKKIFLFQINLFVCVWKHKYI